MLRISCLTMLAAALLGAGSHDPGILLELDREAFELVARDLRDDSAGPRFPVVLGSPRFATPSGRYPLHQVIRHPGWQPGPQARAGGAQPLPPSAEGPLGVAKIPFAAGGSIALHGGAHPLLLGKPVSLGCVRATDPDLVELLDWLEARGALRPAGSQPQRSLRQAFRRPAHIVVR
jgi:hypothetical protein